LQVPWFCPWLKNTLCNIFVQVIYAQTLTGIQDRPVVFFDLGIAFDKSGTSLTAQPLGPGTLRYRAPETLDSDYRASIDFRCDLFSLAVTVYEFAAGFHPIHHGSMSDGETVYRLLNRNAEPLIRHRSDLGQNLCDLIDRCIHKKPALRPNRLGEIKRIVEE
jgi:serine/threonine protein kinase